MSDIATTFSISDWLRLPFVYAHLLLCAFAITEVLRTDVRLLLGRISDAELARVARRVVALLLGLWLSGLMIIWLDTGLDPLVIAAKPKLLLKLLCVSVLTVNGLVLHAFAFPRLSGHGRLTLPASVLVSLSGALSTAHWLLAMFVGATAALDRWSPERLIAGYGAFVLATSLVGIAVAPEMQRRLARRRSARTARAADTRVASAPAVDPMEDFEIDFIRL